MYPKRIVVKEVLKSRYQPGQRPVSWDKRVAGVESIVSFEGEEIDLYSNGQQSSPDVGWELLLTKDNEGEKGEEGVCWTLYGVSKQ